MISLFLLLYSSNWMLHLQLDSTKTYNLYRLTYYIAHNKTPGIARGVYLMSLNQAEIGSDLFSISVDAGGISIQVSSSVCSSDSSMVSVSSS